MAITGKIQDAAAAALSAIEEALDLNEPEAAGKDGAKSEKPKSEKPSIAAAMSASAGASAGASGSSKPDGESVKKADIDIDTNPTLNLQLPRPAKPADKGAAKPADKPAEPFAAARPVNSAAAAQKPAASPTQPRSPAPGSSAPAAKPAPGSSAPAKPAAAAPKPAAPAPKPGASPAPKPAKLAPTTPPANDDRRSIGELRAALNFRPSGTITVMTALSIIAWTGLWTLYVYFHRESILGADGNFFAPTPILTLLALFGPIVFLFVTGIMARRVHEMRLVAKAMTEAAIRLIEPETVATEQVVSLSQAIRREAASMGDGIERALARAGELEVIVRTEVTNLERSYSENERRIRLLIDELAHEREAIILNADNARTSLYGARDSLASEVASASAHLAEQVSAAGNRVTAALGSKAEEVRLALEAAGDGLDRTFAGHGDRLLAALAQSGDDAAQKIGAATDNVAQRFAKGVGEIETKLAVVGDTLSRGFDEHSSGVVQRIEALGQQLSQTIGGENDRLATRLADVSGRLEQTLSTQGGALDATLADSAERLAARVREHVEGARTVFEDAETQLDGLAVRRPSGRARRLRGARPGAARESDARFVPDRAAAWRTRQRRAGAFRGCRRRSRERDRRAGRPRDRNPGRAPARVRADGADPGRRNRRARDGPRRPCAIGAVRTDRRLRKPCHGARQRCRQPCRRAWRPGGRRAGRTARGVRAIGHDGDAARPRTASPKRRTASPKRATARPGR